MLCPTCYRPLHLQPDRTLRCAAHGIIPTRDAAGPLAALRAKHMDEGLAAADGYSPPLFLQWSLLMAWEMAARGHTAYSQGLFEDMMLFGALPRMCRGSDRAFFLVNRLEALLPEHACDKLVATLGRGDPDAGHGVVMWLEELTQPLKSASSSPPQRSKGHSEQEASRLDDRLPPAARNTALIIAALEVSDGIGAAMRAADVIETPVSRRAALATAALELAKRGDGVRADALLPFASSPPLPAERSHSDVVETLAAVSATHLLRGREREAYETLEPLSGDDRLATAMFRLVREVVAAGHIERAIRLADRMPAAAERRKAKEMVFSAAAKGGLMDDAVRIGRSLFTSDQLDERLFSVTASAAKGNTAPIDSTLAMAITDPTMRQTALLLTVQHLTRLDQPERALATAALMSDSPEQVEACISVGKAFARASDTLRARQVWQQATARAEALPDDWQAAHLLGRLGTAAAQAGQTDLAVACLERASERAQAIALCWRRSTCLHELCVRFAAAGMDERARDLMDQSILADHLDAQ